MDKPKQMTRGTPIVLGDSGIIVESYDPIRALHDWLHRPIGEVVSVGKKDPETGLTPCFIHLYTEIEIQAIIEQERRRHEQRDSEEGNGVGG